MFKFIKVSIRFNRVLSNRGGRFLSIYAKGKKYNGKVLTSNPFYAKVQLSRTGPNRIVYVKNWSVSFVIADHAAFFANSK